MRDEEKVDPGPRDWRRTVLRWSRDIAVMAVAVLVLSSVLGRLRAPDLPDVAPPFRLSAIDGSTVALEQFRGQTVVVNLWATWCGPCRAEVPMLSSFAQNNPDIPVLGIAVDRDPSTVADTAAAWGMAYPVLYGGQKMARLYGASTVPTTVVVGPDGTVESAHVGIITNLQLWWMTL